jgi:hypothetical protein
VSCLGAVWVNFLLNTPNPDPTRGAYNDGKDGSVDCDV